MSVRFVIVIGIVVAVITAACALALQSVNQRHEQEDDRAWGAEPEAAIPAQPKLIPATVPPGPAVPRLDQYGDPLPPGVICRIGADRFRGEYSTSVAYSVDGSAVLTANGMSIRSWDARTGRLQPARAIELDGQPPDYHPYYGEAGPAFTPYGDLFGSYWFWNPTQPRPKTLQMPKVGNFPGHLVGVSSDGTRGAFSWQGRLGLWDLVNNRLVEELAALEPPQRDERTGIEVPRSRYRADMLFSRDGKSLVVHNGTGLSIRRADTGKQIRFVPLSSAEGAFTVSGDMRFAATANGSKPTELTVWDLTTGKKLQSLSCLDGYLHRLGFSSDGTRLAGIWEEWVSVWSPADGRELGRSRVDPKNRGHALAFSPDGRTFAIPTNYGVRLHDADTAALRCPVPGWDEWYGRVRLSADGKRVITTRAWSSHGIQQPNGPSGSAGLRIWDVETGQLLEQPDEPFPPVLDLSADGSVLAGLTQDGMFQVWDVPTRKQRPVLVDFPQGIYNVVLSSDGNWLDLQIKNEHSVLELRTWNTKTGRLTWTSPGVSGPHSSVVPQRVSSKGKEGGMELWDLPTGQRLLHLPKVNYSAYADCVWLPNGKEFFVVVASENCWRRWNLETGEELPSIEFPQFFAKDSSRLVHSGKILFLPDGNRIVVQDGRGFTVWDLKNKKPIKSWKGDGSYPWEFAVSADGKRLVASGGYVVMVWDLDAFLKPRG